MRAISFADASEIRHAYIVTSLNEEECFSAAMTIAQAAVCRGGKNLPCGKCPACLKAAGGNHPDIRIFRKGDDPDAKSVISVGQVRSAVLDAAVLPNESERKVYIFRDGGAMNEAAQNASLKLLEEPPKGVILILCAEKPECFLATVRSRCIEISCGGASRERSEWDDLADEYLQAVASGDVLKVYAFCEANNGLKIAEATEFVLSCITALTDMLCARRSDAGIGRERLMALERMMEKCAQYLKVNVNVKQIFGILEVCSVPRKNRKEDNSLRGLN